MFKSIIEFFKKTQEIRDQKFHDYDEFHTMCVREFPKKMRDSLQSKGIHPAISEGKLDFGKWFMGFNAKDILWWRSQYEIHNFMCKPIEEIKKEVMTACLEIVDGMPLSELDGPTKKLYDSILSDTIGGEDEGK